MAWQGFQRNPRRKPARPQLDRLDEVLYDLRLRLTMPGTLDERVVIIDVDEPSLARHGQWPWRRAEVARLIEELIERQQVAALGLDVEEGTLYPLLRRLEKQGLLQSEWDTSEARPRKYYRISAAGQVVLTALRSEWHEMVTVMHNILEGGHHE